MLDFGRRISVVRKAVGMTQEQLAERLGVAPNTIYCYESNGRLPSFETIRNLARVLDVSADYIVGLEDSPSISTRGLNERQITALITLAKAFRDSGGCCNG